MDYDTSQKIRAQLASGESLLWSGRPRQGVIFRGSDIFVIPFSLLWCGFAIFWLMSAYNSGAPPFFVLFGVPFVLVGLSTLTDTTFSSKPDQSGSISFGALHPMSELFGGMNWPGMGAYQGPRFDMIENVKSVYDTILRAKTNQR